MTQEEKQLLLKDLCARLPHGIICHTERGDGHLCSINQTIFGTEYGININPLKRDYFGDSETEEQAVKPYLRPISSMTEKEWREFSIFTGKTETYVQQIRLDSDSIGNPTIGGYKCVYWSLFDKCIDWLNAHHFDVRNLIGRGLAIDCTNLNIY